MLKLVLLVTGIIMLMRNRKWVSHAIIIVFCSCVNFCVFVITIIPICPECIRVDQLRRPIKSYSLTFEFGQIQRLHKYPLFRALFRFQSLQCNWFRSPCPGWWWLIFLICFKVITTYLFTKWLLSAFI